jgi:hypothetical protein
VNNRDPFVYRTSDYGATWRAITNGIPRSMLSYAHVVKEDPVRRGLLYLGTENGVYVSFDAGENWQSLQTNLPHAPVYWITVQEHFNDLVIATYGRGFWILDDLTPLQQLATEAPAADAQLLAPRAAYRFRDITQDASATNDPTIGSNPPYGASINYFLRSVPAGDVTLSIVNDQSQVVRTISAPKAAGLNRVYWDLQDTATPAVRLRTSPLHAPDIRVGPDGWRPGGGSMSLLMPPGAYSVRLNVGGKTVGTEKLEVRKDPNSGGSEAEIREQFKLLTELRRSVEAAADVVNQIELVRGQIVALRQVLETAEILQPATELERKLIAIESNLIEPRITGRGQDGVRWGSQLLGKLNYLANGLASGDFRPTSQQLEVQKVLEERLRKQRSDLDALLGTDLRALNELMRGRGISNIVVRRPTS